MYRLQLAVAIAMGVAVSAAFSFAQIASTQPTSHGAAPNLLIPPDGQPNFSRTSFQPYSQWVSAPLAPEDVAERYSCVIRIDSDALNSGFGYFGSVNDSQSAGALLTSTALIDPAIRSAIKVPVEHAQDCAAVNVFPVGQRLARMEVVLRKIAGYRYPDDAASVLARALIDRLKAAYAESAAASRKAATTRQEPVEKQIDALKSKIDALRAKESEARGNSYAYSGVNASFELNNLRNQKKSMESELNRNRARLETLDPNSGPLIAQWNDVVSIRQKEVDELKKTVEERKADAAELRAAESKLADAKTQLAQARQIRSADSVNSSYRSSEIPALRSTISDEQDRLKDLDERIAKLQDPKFVALLEQLPDMQNDENRLRNQLVDLQNKSDQIQRSAQDDGKVTITVLDGGSKN